MMVITFLLMTTNAFSQQTTIISSPKSPHACTPTNVTIAFQGGEGTGADNWNFLPIETATSIARLKPGINTDYARSGTHSIRAGGGDNSGCTDPTPGQNCIMGSGNARGCPRNDSVIEFENKSISCYSNVKLTFYHGNEESCNGSGFDGEDSLYVEVRLDNGAWTRIYTMGGSGASPFNYKWNFGTPVVGAGPTMPNPVVYNVPTGTKQFAFRTVARVNRSDEIYYIDDVSLTGTTICGPVITTQPAASPVCANNSLTIPIAATSDLPVTYQWEINTGSGWVNLPPGSPYSVSASGNLNINPVTVAMDGYQYRVTLSNGCDVSTLSNATTLSVKPGPALTSAPSVSPGTICAGAGTIQLTASAGSGETIEWFTGSCGGSSAGTGSPLTLSAPSATTTYFVRAMNSCGNSACDQVTVTVGGTVTPIIDIQPAAPQICEGTTLTFNANVQNQGTSPSYKWSVNGAFVGNSSTYANSSLKDNDIVSCELTSSDPCASPASVQEQVQVKVTPKATPAVSINPSSPQACAGSVITFTALAANLSTTPDYQWKVNGFATGSNSSTFSSNLLNNNDVVSCLINTSETCVTSATASDQVTVKISSAINPGISITPDKAAICAGQAVSFTANVTGEGNSPIYKWSVNGAMSGANSKMFTSSTLADNDEVICTLTSSELCASPSTVVSSPIKIKVNPVIVPGVSITASATMVCGGQSVSFNATPLNGGASPAYQWFVNGISMGSGSATFSSTLLSNADIISCQLTTSATCASTPTATSNLLSLIVKPKVTPSILVNPPSVIICQGTPVIFTADTSNAGKSAVLQWMLNGADVNVNSLTYTNNTLANGDKVTCRLISSETCVTTAYVTSAEVPVTLSSSIIPKILKIDGPATDPCPGETVVFTAQAVGQGAAPVYEWKLNGVIAGGNSPSFTGNLFNNGDLLECKVTSSESCASPKTSDPLSRVVSVRSFAIPSISISAVPMLVCPGTPVFFTTVQVNGAGASPVYQWQVNGVNAGTNSPNFVSSTIQNGDKVQCILTSSDACANPVTAKSETIPISVTNSIIPSVVVSADLNPSLPGELVTFTALASGQGSAPAYQWKLNGVNVGSGGPTFASNTLNNGDQVSCELVSSESCASPNFAISPAVIVNILAALLPGFDQLGPYCKKSEPDPLPKTSINSIVGTWNPATISTSAAGSYVYKFTPDPGQNAIESTMTVVVNDLPHISISDTDIVLTPTLTMDAGASATGNYLYTWQFLDQGQWIDAGNDKLLAVLKAGNYRVIVTDIMLCRDTVEVRVRPPGVRMIVPSAFTPDGDSKNDIFKPVFPDEVPDTYLLLIYNKWGQLLFASNSTQAGWDGKVNNMLSPPGAYVYYISYSNRLNLPDATTEKRRGILTLLH